MSNSQKEHEGDIRPQTVVPAPEPTPPPDRFRINRWLMTSQEFQFKRHYSRLMEGICPKCGHFSCIVNMENPDRIRCSRLNQCGWSAPVSAYFPQISKEGMK